MPYGIWSNRYAVPFLESGRKLLGVWRYGKIQASRTVKRDETMEEMDNLTRDVLAAEAAGFGPWYGRYIAAFGHTERPVQEKTPENIATCKGCGAEFLQQKRWPRQYCSPECREKARQRQRDESARKRKARMAACAAPPE